MAHSLEARSPFLDHSLTELVATFPSNMKIRGRTLKYALRKLAAEYLPPEIVNRPKQGFMFPVAYWFRNDLYEPVKRILMSSNLVTEGVFNRDTVLTLVENHRNNGQDNHVRIWMLLNLEIWHRLYIEQHPIESVEAWIEDQMNGAVV